MHGTTIGGIKGDTRSLDYSSHGGVPSPSIMRGMLLRSIGKIVAQGAEQSQNLLAQTSESLRSLNPKGLG